MTLDLPAVKLLRLCSSFRVNLKHPSSALLGIVAMLACSGPLVVAADSPRFERDILPVFYHHCFGCHSEKQAKPKGKLRLDLAEGIRKSDTIVAGKPDESELL